LADYI